MKTSLCTIEDGCPFRFGCVKKYDPRWESHCSRARAIKDAADENRPYLRPTWNTRAGSPAPPAAAPVVQPTRRRAPALPPPPGGRARQPPATMFAEDLPVGAVPPGLDHLEADLAPGAQLMRATDSRGRRAYYVPLLDGRRHILSRETTDIEVE